MFFVALFWWLVVCFNVLLWSGKIDRYVMPLGEWFIKFHANVREKVRTWWRRFKRRGKTPDFEKHFKETFDMMTELFGKRSKISSDDRYMYVECRHCDKKNRLHQGIEGSRCGSCKKFLRTQPGEAPPAKRDGSSMVN